MEVCLWPLVLTAPRRQRGGYPYLAGTSKCLADSLNRLALGPVHGPFLLSAKRAQFMQESRKLPRYPSSDGMDPRHSASVDDEGLERRIFAALDQQRIGDDGDAWVAYVMGVHVSGRDVWIQVAKDDRGAETIVLHLSADTTSDNLLFSLRTSTESAALSRPATPSHRHG